MTAAPSRAVKAINAKTLLQTTPLRKERTDIPEPSAGLIVPISVSNVMLGRRRRETEFRVASRPPHKKKAIRGCEITELAVQTRIIAAHQPSLRDQPYKPAGENGAVKIEIRRNWPGIKGSAQKKVGAKPTRTIASRIRLKMKKNRSLRFARIFEVPVWLPIRSPFDLRSGKFGV